MESNRRTTHFVYLSYLFRVLLLTVSTSTHADTKCLTNEYYVPKNDTCLTCEMCPIGKETISEQDWPISVKHKQGPTECRGCVTCKPGSYSDARAYQCKKCTVCSDLGKIEERQCTAQTDTVCIDRNLHVTTKESVDGMTVSETEGVSENFTNTDENNIGVIEENHSLVTVLASLGCVAFIVFIVIGIFFLHEEWKKRKGNVKNSSLLIHGADTECYSLGSTIRQRPSTGVIPEHVNIEYQTADERQSEHVTSFKIKKEEMDPLLMDSQIMKEIKNERWNSVPVCLSCPDPFHAATSSADSMKID